MKKINLSIVFVILAVLGLTISSCKEICDEVPVVEESNSNMDISEFKNEKNEFENYGEIHNKTLDFLGERFGGKLLETPYKEVQTALNDFAKSMGQELKEEDYAVVEQALSCAKDGGIIDGGCVRDPFCALFPRKCDFFDRMMKPWTHKTIDNPDDIRSFIAECKKFEVEIMNDEDLELKSRGNGLKAMCITRYSTYYWQKQNSNPDGSVWAGELQSAKSVCWSCIIAGDALGAVGGPFTAGLVSGILLSNQANQ